MARFHGLHPEEAQARLAARELPLPFCQSDALRYLVAEIGVPVCLSVCLTVYLSVCLSV
jgi:hypothetical protein